MFTVCLVPMVRAADHPTDTLHLRMLTISDSDDPTGQLLHLEKKVIL